MVGEVGHPVETVSRIVPIVERFETCDPGVADLDRVIPDLIFLFHRQCLKTKHGVVRLEVQALCLTVHMLGYRPLLFSLAITIFLFSTSIGLFSESFKEPLAPKYIVQVILSDFLLFNLALLPLGLIING